MSLLQQLSSAALVVTANASQNNTELPGAKSSSSNVQGLLEQLAASIAAIHEHHHQQQQQLQQQQQEQGIASSPARTRPRAAAPDSASKFVQEVQAGLQATNEQLQRLLAQRGNTSQLSLLALQPPSEQQQQQQQPARTTAPAPAQAGCTSTSTAVLQKLLQLAAGDSRGTAATAPHDDGAALTPYNVARQQHVPSTLLQLAGSQAVPASSQQQQQEEEWRRAALEALQLFSFQELEQLPPHSLQQALLLQPQLLDRFLEAAAAAVLKPLLPSPPTSPPAAAAAAADVQHPGPQSHLTGQPDIVLPQASRVSAAAAVAAADSNRTSASGSACGMQNMQSLLAASCPWMQSLSAMLAQHPVLLLRASSTLLSWLEASGHTRLWQLLSSTCRPAWQQLAATPPPVDRHALDAVSSSAPADAMYASEPTAAQAGSLQLLCPQEWQQQLVLLLVEEPSVLGLLQLLQQLPGLALQEHYHHHHQQQQEQPTGQQDTRGWGTPGAVSNAGQVQEDPWCSDALLAWPSAQEWGQPASLQVASAESGSSQQGVAVHDRAQVLLAWGLVMQHHCWYQFACSLLVSSSLLYLLLQRDQHTQQPQRREQQQHAGLSRAPQLLQQLLQMPAQELQQQSHELEAAQLAAAGAAFIAWVHQPVETDRQAALLDQLLSAVTTAAGNGRSLQPPPPLGLVACLLDSWKASLCPQKQLPPAHPDRYEPQQQEQQQTCLQSAAAVAPSSLQHSQSWVSPALFAEDLPCAVLQQRRLLLQCSTQELVDLCLAAASWGVVVADDAAPSAAALAVGTDGNSAGLAGLPTSTAGQCLQPGVGSGTCKARASKAALCHLLDCSNALCAAALEVVNLTLQHKMQQQQQPSSSMHLSWLARQWLSDGVGADGTAGPGSVVPDLSVAKQLLAAATGIDQCLKQHGS